jgi:FKBP-type peptidyl-prolyl cis-trans isomerase FkpA
VERVRAAKYVVASVLVLALVTACGESPTAPTPNVPFSTTDVRVGTGAEAVTGKIVTAHYTGWLYDSTKADRKGIQFTSSLGTTGFAWMVGAGEVIEGMDRGVTGMRAGGLRRIVMPPELAYGNERNGPIPPNSTLIFELDLLAVTDAE